MIPDSVRQMLALADASWHEALERALAAVDAADPDYLPSLVASRFLPTEGRLFAAFRLPLASVRHVLVGEGPYPREASATGTCFMDGAVDALWSEQGLSKPVNRATSLRNFIKMLLVAEGALDADRTSGEAMAAVATRARSGADRRIETLPELQQALLDHGFLLLNASLVFRPEVAPRKDAEAWKPFLEVVLGTLAERTGLAPPTLVLWGKVAERVLAVKGVERFPLQVAEHPYNLSFIRHAGMKAFFRPFALLGKRTTMST